MRNELLTIMKGLIPLPLQLTQNDNGINIPQYLHYPFTVKVGRFYHITLLNTEVVFSRQASSSMILVVMETKVVIPTLLHF